MKAALSLAGRLVTGSAVLVLCGCGGGGGGMPGALPGPNVVPVQVVVSWPASSRAIPTSAQTIHITVTGTGITAPIQGTITKPETTTTLYVPPGNGRTFTAVAKDATGIVVASGSKDNVEIKAGQTNTVQIVLGQPQGGTSTLTIDWTDQPAPVNTTVDWNERPTGTANVTGDWKETPSGQASVSVEWKE